MKNAKRYQDSHKHKNDMNKSVIKYTTSDASKIDKEVRKLSGMHSVARVKFGLELAKRLKEIEDNKLYLKLDEKAYPNFNKYIDSIGVSYKSVRELIGLYNTYVVSAGYSIDELAEISYHKLTQLKPYLFEKKDGVYEMSKSKSEINKWVKDASSDLTINDLRQKRIEAEVGEHEHKWKIIKYKVCEFCDLKEASF